MMSLPQQKKLVSKLRSKFKEGVLLDAPFPKPFCADPSNVRAIYLGCDPSNNHCRCLEYVFALPNGDPPMFRRMVNQIGENLQCVELAWDSVYAQNLCRNYFKEETAKNPIWEAVAQQWIPILRKELNQFGKNIPVLLSADVLYRVLIKDKSLAQRASDYYNCKPGADIPIPSQQNWLDRPLIPFYRHRSYQLKDDSWRAYKNRIRDCLTAIHEDSKPR